MAKNYKFATKESLLKPKTHRFELSDGSVVFIRTLTAAQAFAIQQMKDEDKAFEAVAASLCDEHGTTLLTAEEAAQLDVVLLSELQAGITQFNGISQKDVEKAQADLKNAQTEGSTSSSPKS